MNEKLNPFDRLALIVLLVVLTLIAYLAYQGQPININVDVEQNVGQQPWATHVPSPLPTAAAPTINDAMPVEAQTGVQHHSKTRRGQP